MVAETIRLVAASGTALELCGFLNDSIPAGAMLTGGPVIGRFEQWRDCPSDVEFISAISKAKLAVSRYQRLMSLGIPEGRWASIIHPTACVAEDASIGPGSYVGPFATLEPGVNTGAHTCLRGHCYISHDVQIGDFVFVGSGATLLGRITLGDGAHVGPGAVCHDDISIGRYAVVGVGAVVIRSVPEFSIVAGNPARQLGEIELRP